MTSVARQADILCSGVLLTILHICTDTYIHTCMHFLLPQVRVLPSAPFSFTPPSPVVLLQWFCGDSICMALSQDGEVLRGDSILFGHVITVKRSPLSFKELTETGPCLEHLRERMTPANRQLLFQNGAKAFILPQHHELVMQHIQDNGVVFQYDVHGKTTYLCELRKQHLIVSDEWVNEIIDAIRTLPGKDNVGVRNRAEIWIPVTAIPDWLLLGVGSLPRASSSEVPLPKQISQEAKEYQEWFRSAVDQWIDRIKGIHEKQQGESEDGEGDLDVGHRQSGACGSNE